jgi:hypothetical protein
LELLSWFKPGIGGSSTRFLEQLMEWGERNPSSPSFLELVSFLFIKVPVVVIPCDQDGFLPLSFLHPTTNFIAYLTGVTIYFS